jgi:hypothetical protein
MCERTTVPWPSNTREMRLRTATMQAGRRLFRSGMVTTALAVVKSVMPMETASKYGSGL